MPKPHSTKFLIDESVEYGIVVFPRSQDSDVVSISEENPSISDPEVLHLASKQKRILITNDKGFSKLVFKEKQKSRGVILIRLPYATTSEKILRLDELIKSKAAKLTKSFTTIGRKRNRAKPLPRP